jgi:hypothetical protein
MAIRYLQPGKPNQNACIECFNPPSAKWQPEVLFLKGLLDGAAYRVTKSALALPR